MAFINAVLSESGIGDKRITASICRNSSSVSAPTSAINAARSRVSFVVIPFVLSLPPHAGRRMRCATAARRVLGVKCFP